MVHEIFTSQRGNLVSEGRGNSFDEERRRVPMFDDQPPKKVLATQTRRRSASFETGPRGKYLTQYRQQGGKWVGRALGPIVDLSNGVFSGHESVVALETGDTEEEVKRLIRSAIERHGA
jgi:hypothetical protein